MAKRDADGELVLDRAGEFYLREVIARCHDEWRRLAHTPIGIHKSLAATFGFEPPVAQRHVGGSSSLEIGTLVHAQVQEYANAHPPLLPPSRAALHPYTRALLVLLDKHGWRPIGSEVPLYDPASQIGTRADLFAFDQRQRRIVLIELKTGHDVGYRAALRRRRPLPVLPASVRDTLETRAHLQLAWMDWLARERYALPRLHSVVVRVNATRGAEEPEPLRRWARKMQAAIVAALRATP